MSDRFEEQRRWPLGVIHSVSSDAIPDGAVYRADNAVLDKVGGSEAVWRKRLGLTMAHATPFSVDGNGVGDPAVGVGEYLYHPTSTSTTPYLLTVGRDGVLRVAQDNGGLNTFTEITSTGLSATTEEPDWVVAKNRLFVLDGAGGSQALLGTAKVAWGVPVCTFPVTPLVATGVGDMTGDYDVMVTRWNSTTGAESDWSAVVSLTGLTVDQLQISVNAAPSADTHLFFRVYLRKPSLDGSFYRVLAGTGYDATQQGFPLASAGATVTTTINVSDATFQALVLRPAVPGTRGLPPIGIKYIAWWRRRLFVATESVLYWSEEDLPDAFDTALNFHPIDDGRGGDIRGIKTPFDQCVIFTSRTRWEIVGTDDPRSWVLAMTDTEHGLASTRSFVVSRGVAYWWTQQEGPVQWNGGPGPAEPIGLARIRDSVTAPAVNAAAITRVQAATANDRVIFAVPELAATDRLGRLLSFRTDLGSWESDRWDPMDARAIGTATKLDGTTGLYLANMNGLILRMLEGSHDGLPSGFDGVIPFTATATTMATYTDGAAPFPASGGLIERKVTVITTAGVPITGTVRPYISGNTTTVLTFSSTITGLIVGQDYYLLLGGPDFQLETGWRDMGAPLIAKRFDQAFVQIRVDSGVSSFAVDSAFDFDAVRTVSPSTADFGLGVLDVALLDELVLDDANVLTRKLWLGRVGLVYRLRIRNPYPDQGFAVLKHAVLARELNERQVVNL